MTVRCFTLEGILVFLEGAGETLSPSPTVPPPGNQPPDERALNFPQFAAFRVEHSVQPITPLTEPVDENTQP